MIDKINKKKSISKVKVSSISINTTTTKKYLSNINYSSILYILLKKEFTYYGEIRKLLGITVNFHLPNLERDGLVIRRDPTSNELEYLKLLKRTVGIKQLKNNIYSLTDDGYKYLTQPKIYDIIKIFASKGIDDYIILQKNRYEQLKFQEERSWELKKRALKSQGISFGGKD